MRARISRRGRLVVHVAVLASNLERRVQRAWRGLPGDVGTTTPTRLGGPRRPRLQERAGPELPHPASGRQQ